MIDGLFRLIAPHSCCGCGLTGVLLCDQCKYDIISEPFNQCLLCLRPTQDASLCHPCSVSSKLAGAWCVGVRKGTLRTLLERYKYDSAREAAHHCVELLDALLPVLPSALTVVPVPTSPAHRRVRGFDHTALIARSLARRRRLHYGELLRRHGSETQHFKGRGARADIVDQLSRSGAVSGPILLIDDIYTTGSTLAACSRLLRDGGCTSLYGAIIARQTLDETDYL